MENSWKFQGVGGGGVMLPSETENPGGGWGIKLENNPLWGGIDIFWNRTIIRFSLHIQGSWSIEATSTCRSEVVNS